MLNTILLVIILFVVCLLAFLITSKEKQMIDLQYDVLGLDARIKQIEKTYVRKRENRIC